MVDATTPTTRVAVTPENADAALATLPTASDTELADTRRYATAHANEDQMETVRRALKDRPTKPDAEAAVLAAASAIVTGYKVLGGPLKTGQWDTFGGFDVVVIIFLAATAYMAVHKYFAAKSKVDSQNEQALQIVERLLDAQKKKGRDSAMRQ